MDDRSTSAIGELEDQREPLIDVERVCAPILFGIACALRDQGFDHYASQIDDIAKRAAATCKATRLLVEQLSTLTDPRLEQTEPRIPAPPKGG